MTPKMGILHDYDLMANAEPSAQKDNTCIVCGSTPVSYQWSDYSGEAMCRKCGTPYQLKWGTGEQQKESNYPYCRLKPEFIAVLKEYYQETKRFTCLGWMMGGPQPGYAAFVSWLKVHHSEWIKG